MSDVFELVGKVVSFEYPAANYEGVRKRLERRRVRILSVQDTEAEPIPKADIDRDPRLQRSRYLITGMDIDIAAPRSFYHGSMHDLKVVNLPTADVLLFDAANAEHVYRADDEGDARWYVREWLEREAMDPIGLVPAIRVHQACTTEAA